MPLPRRAPATQHLPSVSPAPLPTAAAEEIVTALRTDDTADHILATVPTQTWARLTPADMRPDPS